MPKPRTPTNILRLSGALARNPGRHADRLNEPKPTSPIGMAPEWMTETERASWDWLVARCHPGTLSNADEGIVELTATLRASVIDRSATAREKALLRLCFNELGMTPASRSKVSVTTGEEAQAPNEFAV